ncbi:MAG: agmatine deiminase family protein, partial [Bacteroidaceae bacterium]|nr:agmatine deiminase family protein [Bacteroidaceae bacterium]
MSLIAYAIQKEDEGKTLRLNATEFFDTQKKLKTTYLPSEWALQSGIQLTWPHAKTDWAYMLDEVKACYHKLAKEIASRQTLLIVTPDVEHTQTELQTCLSKAEMKNVRFFECPTNDTWARDHAFITLKNENECLLADFRFNGWGQKFAANYDNQICRRLVDAGLLNGHYVNCQDFVLEGGSIESDGCGTLLTTTECLTAPNRNEPMDKAEIEGYLVKLFNLKQVLWLDHGYLAGDDTDSHIDTLARICPNDTITYVQCLDKEDEHYEALHLMEEQLKTFRTLEG